jgi:hypothetical protein
MSLRSRRWYRLLPVIVLLCLAAGVPAVRRAALRSLGWALVADEPVEPADVIVVPQWAGNAGALDAADLVHHGLASRVAILARPPKAADLELTRRGIPYQDEITDMVQLFGALRVPEIEVIPNLAAGTEAEGSVLPSWFDHHQYRSIILVSPPDHSRRVRRVLRRSMRGRAGKVMIRSARYSSFDPDQWWTTRDGVRTEIVELQKLALDVVRHPIS